MIISWQGTDWCAKSFYDWVTCMTRWPVWLGNLYDLYDKVTSLTRWPLSLGDLYDLHDQATSITGWLLWPACPSDIYHWVTSMTMWPVSPQWLDDLYDRVTSLTWRSPWPDDFYDCVITFNQDVFKNCKYSITRNTNRSLFFSQDKEMCQIRVICNLFKTVFSFLVLQKESMSEGFGKISWNLFDSKPTSSHSLCQDIFGS